MSGTRIDIDRPTEGLPSLIWWYAVEVIVGAATIALLVVVVVILGAWCLAIEAGYACAHVTTSLRAKVRR